MLPPSASYELLATYIYYHQRDIICEIPKPCSKFHIMHFCLQAEVIAGGI